MSPRFPAPRETRLERTTPRPSRPPSAGSPRGGHRSPADSGLASRGSPSRARNGPRGGFWLAFLQGFAPSSLRQSKVPALGPEAIGMAAESVMSFIGGRFAEPSSDEMEAVPNPATGETLAIVRYSSPEEIDNAVRAAATALPLW